MKPIFTVSCVSAWVDDRAPSAMAAIPATIFPRSMDFLPLNLTFAHVCCGVPTIGASGARHQPGNIASPASKQGVVSNSKDSAIMQFRSSMALTPAVALAPGIDAALDDGEQARGNRRKRDAVACHDTERAGNAG